MKDFEIIKNSVLRGDRLWDKSDEREFVQKADEELLETYFERYKLSDWNEVILLERDASCIMKYTLHHHLSVKAEIALIKKGNLELIQSYLQRISNKAMIKAVQAENKPIIKMLILQNYSWPDEVQMALVKLADEEMLKLYLGSHSFCEKAEAFMIESLSPEFVKSYIGEHSLQADAEVALVKRGNKELIEAYLRQYKKFTYWMSEDELLILNDSELIALFIENSHHFGRTYLSTKMIEIGDPKLVRLYFSKYALNCEDEIALVKLKNFELLNAYMNKLADDNRTMKRETFWEINKWKSEVERKTLRFNPKKHKQCLPPDLEASFLKNNENAIMRAYISKHPLSFERELELVKTGARDLVENYIWHYYLSDEAEVELVRLGDRKLIEIYQQFYRLSKDAEVEFLNSGFNDLIETYNNAVAETEKANELLGKFEALPNLRFF